MTDRIVQFVKDWTLPVAMAVGAVVYFLFAGIPLLAPVRPYLHRLVGVLTPALIFTMLFLTFCKVALHDLRPRRWHLWLILLQTGFCLGIALLLLYLPLAFREKVVAEAAMVCFICPTATAAAVITGKLGGNASTLTTYTILSNLVAAIVVPVLFPLVEPHEGVTFLPACWTILSKVFPLLICPFLAAMAVRRYFPRLLAKLLRWHDLAFYLWSVALAIVVAQTIHSIVHSRADISTLFSIGGAGLFACCLQFFLGKQIGGRYHERISGGQAFGQKNTILAIWMAYTYLLPLSSLGPGSYVLWQNVINSWQLWKKRRK